MAANTVGKTSISKATTTFTVTDILYTSVGGATTTAFSEKLSMKTDTETVTPAPSYVLLNGETTVIGDPTTITDTHTVNETSAASTTTQTTTTFAQPVPATVTVTLPGNTITKPADTIFLTEPASTVH